MAELISGPVMSVALVILAGIALRYALHMGKDNDLGQSLPSGDQRERIAALSLALERAQQDQLKAHENFERVVEDYETLKRSVDARDLQWNKQRSETAEKLARIEELNQAHDNSQRAVRELTAELEQQQALRKQESESLRQQLHDQQRQIEQLAHVKSSVQESQEQSEREVAALQTELCETEMELSRLQKHNEELSGLQAEVTSLREELGVQRQENAQLRAENFELQASVTRLSEQSKQQAEETSRLYAAIQQADQHVTILQAEKRFSDQLRRDNGKLSESLARQEQRIADLQRTERVLHGQLSDLQAELSSQVSKREQLEAQLQQAREQTAELNQLRSQTRQVVAQLAEQQAAYDDQLRILRTEKDELARGLVREQQQAGQLQALLHAESERVRKIQFELSHLDLVRRDHQAVVAELEELKQDHTSAARKLEQSELQLRGIQEKALAISSRAKHFEQELLQERSASQSLRDENAKLKKQFSQLYAEKAAIEQLLKVHAETLQKLRADSLSIETLLERQAAVQSSLREHADRLRAVAADLRSGHDPAQLAQTAESMATVLSFPRKPAAASRVA